MGDPRRPAGEGAPLRWFLPLVGLAVLLATTASAARSQAPPFSSTLRYGSGYFDVPAAIVLPSLAFRATYSAFRVDVSRDPEVDPSGAVSDPGEARSGFHGDAAFSLGLWDRIELGTTLQSFARGPAGGTQAGVFGKLLLLDPTRSGLGLAVGGRYVSAPDMGDGVKRAPGRLGFGDPRLRASFEGGPSVDTRVTLYGVASLFLPGIRIPGLPTNQVSLSAGYGTGMFADGGDLGWYGPGGNGGWFVGGGWEVAAGSGTVVAVRAEHNGFDVNAGVELAWRGLRVGAHGLGLNHGEGTSVYRSRKAGFSLSLTACPLLRRACRPGLRAGAPADTVRLPAPPPDTVVVERVVGSPSPAGEPRQLCLSTGEDAWVLVTVAGDTLVGPERRRLGSLPAGTGLPGRYARGADWYRDGGAVELPAGRFEADGPVSSPACAALRSWGEYRGVPLFQLRDSEDPPAVLFLPVEPGLWQRLRRVGRRPEVP
jgi:hypothetical protein